MFTALLLLAPLGVVVASLLVFCRRMDELFGEAPAAGAASSGVRSSRSASTRSLA